MLRRKEIVDFVNIFTIMSVNGNDRAKFMVKTVRNSQQRLGLAGLEGSRGQTMAAAEQALVHQTRQDPMVLELRSQAQLMAPDYLVLRVTLIKMA